MNISVGITHNSSKFARSINKIQLEGIFLRILLWVPVFIFTLGAKQSNKLRHASQEKILENTHSEFQIDNLIKKK